MTTSSFMQRDKTLLCRGVCSAVGVGSDAVPDPDQTRHFDVSWLEGFYNRSRASRSLTGIRPHISVSKQDVLLFDQVIVTGFERRLDMFPRLPSGFVAAAEYLAEEGFIYPGPMTVFETTVFNDRLERIARGAGVKLRQGAIDTLWSEVDEAVKSLMSSHEYETIMDALGWWSPWLPSILARDLKRLGCLASPIYSSCHPPEPVHVPQALAEGPTTVTCDLIEVVTDYIPTPAEDVPLHEILEFSRDPETRELKQHLLRATARANLNQVTPESFALQLEESLAAYKEHMKLLQAKSRGPVMKLVIAATGAVEELLHLRPRKAVEALLEFHTSRVTGLEAKLKAEGRETAFIYEAEKAFPPAG
jgi:hypothetical protein